MNRKEEAVLVANGPVAPARDLFVVEIVPDDAVYEGKTAPSQRLCQLETVTFCTVPKG